MLSTVSWQGLQITSLYLANAGIPFFTQSVFYQILLVIPIIAIEAYVHRKLLNLTIVKALWIAAATNVASTIFGGLLIILPFGAFIGTTVFGSPVPVQPGDFPFLPIEIAVTLIPMFVFSYFLELWLGSLGLKEIAKPKIKRSFLVGNSFTYLMLETLAITQLIKGYLEGRN